MGEGRGGRVKLFQGLGEIWERIELVKVLRNIWEKMVDILYPRRCLVCDEILEAAEEDIHPRCEKYVMRIQGPTCMHCGRPVVMETAEYCFDCTRKKKYGFECTFDQGKSLLLYQGAVKKTMYRFKYSNKREYAVSFAAIAVEQVGEWIEQCQIEAIIPVPMFRKKQSRRGYNQAEVFAKCLSGQGGIPVEKGLVIRVKDTTPMKELNDIERKNNLKNAFQMKKNIVKYRRVLLVDDIYTTGSTADEVSRVLKEAGVEKVFFLSICMGQGI